MNAIIRMQPLNVRRKPCYPLQIVGTVPRDEQPHRVSGTWELDDSREMPHYVRVWADDGRGFDFEVDAAAPANWRFLKSITFYQDLKVMPRIQ